MYEDLAAGKYTFLVGPRVVSLAFVFGMGSLTVNYIRRINVDTRSPFWSEGWYLSFLQSYLFTGRSIYDYFIASGSWEGGVCWSVLSS